MTDQLKPLPKSLSERLATLARLPDNWGYAGEEPPSANAVEFARDAAQRLVRRGFESLVFNPMPDGGIAIELYDVEGSNYFLEFYNDGDNHFVKQTDLDCEIREFFFASLDEVLLWIPN